MKKIFLLSEGTLFESDEKFNVITDEQLQWAKEEIAKHTDPAKEKDGRFFVIEVTGAKQRYFTFWVYLPKSLRNPYHYMGNLSLDFETSVNKAIERTNGFPIVIDVDHTIIGKYYETHFPFGKYRNQSIDEVYQQDPKYFNWLKTENEKQKMHGKKGFIPKAIEDQIYELAQLYIDTQIKHNVETSKSAHSHSVGEKITVPLKIYAAKEHTFEEYPSKKDTKVAVDYVTFYLIDENENKYLIYNLHEKIPQINVLPTKTFLSQEQFSFALSRFKQEMEKLKNTPLVITGKVKDNKERMGIKFTQLNYVKVQS